MRHGEIHGESYALESYSFVLLVSMLCVPI